MTDFRIKLRTETGSRSFLETVDNAASKDAALCVAVERIAFAHDVTANPLVTLWCQEIDAEVTPVIFRASRDKRAEITAVFPCEPGTTNDDGSMSCYGHVGQHGQCDRGWYNTTRAARPDEYAGLQRELEGAPYGYRFKVYARMRREFHATRRAVIRDIKTKA